MPPERDALCNADLNVTGQFVAASTPDPTLGCTPDGAWTLMAAVKTCQSDSDCDSAPCTSGMCSDCMSVPLAQSYNMTVTGTQHMTTITNNNTKPNENDSLQMNTENDACNGSFDLVIPNGNQFDYVQLNASTPDYCPDMTDGSDGGLSCGSAGGSRRRT